MAEVPQFQATEQIAPTNTAEAAAVMRGRRAGSIGNEEATAIRQGSAAVAGDFETLGKTIQRHAEQHDIMNGSSESAELVQRLHNSYKAYLKDADPADPNPAARWQEETMKPAIVDFVSRRQTDAGRRWATEHGASISTELYKISSAADMERQDALAKSMLSKTVNNLSTLARDPSTGDLAFKMLDDQVNGIIQAVPGMSVKELQDAKTNYKQIAGREIARSRIEGVMDANPARGKSMLEGGQYKEFITPELYEHLETYARGVEQHQRADTLTNISLRDHQRRETDFQAQQQFYENLPIDPKTHLPIYPENFLQDLNKSPNFEPATKRILTEGFYRTMGRESKENDAEVFKSFTDRMELPPDDPKFPTLDQARDALAQGMTPAHVSFLQNQIRRATTDPSTKNLVEQTMHEIGALATSSNDQVGMAAVTRAKTYFWQQYKGDPLQLDPDSPSYVFKGRSIKSFGQVTGDDAIPRETNHYQRAAGDAVDVALQVLSIASKMPAAEANATLRDKGFNVDVNGPWCAPLVSEVFRHVGLPTPESPTFASSYENWGYAVSNPADIAKGDVFYVPAAGFTGHTGLLTGATRAGSGGLEVQVVSTHLQGSPDNKGGVEWRSVKNMTIRSPVPTVERIFQEPRGFGVFGLAPFGRTPVTRTVPLQGAPQ